MDISQILSMLPSLYQILKEVLVKKGESTLAKKLEENKEEILRKLEEVVKQSKEKFDLGITIADSANINVQTFINSPQYYNVLGDYAVDTAAGSGSFLMGSPEAQLNFPDPAPYWDKLIGQMGRVVNALEKKIEATRKPMVKIEAKDRWTNGGCRILVDNRGEERITLKKIVFKWEYIGHEEDWYDFSKDYKKKFFKGDKDIIQFDVPRHFIEEKAPKGMDEEQIKKIMFLINTTIEVHYEDSIRNKYMEPLDLGRFAS